MEPYWLSLARASRLWRAKCAAEPPDLVVFGRQCGPHQRWGLKAIIERCQCGTVLVSCDDREHRTTGSGDKGSQGEMEARRTGKDEERRRRGCQDQRNTGSRCQGRTGSPDTRGVGPKENQRITGGWSNRMPCSWDHRMLLAEDRRRLSSGDQMIMWCRYRRITGQQEHPILLSKDRCICLSFRHGIMLSLDGGIL